MSASQTGSRAFLLAVGLSALVAAAALARRQPPSPKSLHAPSSEFSAGRARKILRRLVGDGVPHPVGSEGHDRMRQRVVAELEGMGYQPVLQTALACGRYGTCARVANVVARLPGRASGRAVMLCAHYDSVGAGPGASDDAMGVAAILEIARIWKSAPAPRNPILFLLDDGEEAGLLGAEAFAADPARAREVGTVINLENRGTSGPSYLFETSEDNGGLIDLAAHTMARPATSSFFYTVYKLLPNDTDLTVFREHGFPGVNFAAIGDVSRYHTPRDDFAGASPATLQHHGDNTLEMSRALANADLQGPRREDAVFFDLLGTTIMRWPSSMAAPLAVATILLLAAALLLTRRSEPFSARSVGWGLLFGLAAVPLAAAAGFLVSRVPRATGALPVLWVAHPAWLLSALWMAALLTVWLAAAMVKRRAGPPGLLAGVWIWWSLAALALAVTLPGLSFLFLVPAAGAALCMLAARSVDPAAVVGCCCAAFFWLPTAWLLYAALGCSGAVIAALVGLWASTAATLFAALPRRPMSLTLILLAAATAIGLGGATLAPPFSSHVPQRMPIAWHLDADSGQARWLVFPESNRISSAMREAAPFAKDPIAPFPWSGSTRAFAAAVKVQTLPAPELLVRQEYRDIAGRHLRGTLRSWRGAREVFLALPPASRASIQIGGRSFPPLSARWLSWHGGWRVLSCLTTDPEGVEIEIVDASAASCLELTLGDSSPGLPEGGERLTRSRGSAAVTSQDGDKTVVTRRVRL